MIRPKSFVYTFSPKPATTGLIWSVPEPAVTHLGNQKGKKHEKYKNIKNCCKKLNEHKMAQKDAED